MGRTVSDLWRAELLPIRDGLYRADGQARAVRLDPAVDDGLVLLEPFDLAEFLRTDPDWLTRIDRTGERELAGGRGHVCHGGGSHGSEGWLAGLDRRRRLVWVLYLAESNPFMAVTVRGNFATFASTSEVKVTVDLAAPEFGQGER